ncbi:MAG: RdgB/HAM1 family non-canonical purine NTP pyrophosphatase [Clostridiaceae bacterium]|mgnify:CR=1 FL=1|nr:RdgB/HAM1 family non-canonical purine NTP pyrophosphatase [Clostridiaceae bacterium]
MDKLVIASGNTGKITEIKAILNELPLKVVSMKEEGYNPEFDEIGATFSENALIKAKTLNKVVNGIVLADDSGLEIDFLNGAPGIFTSRFAGENVSQEEKNNKIIYLLKGIDKRYRTARFVCSIAFISNSITFTVEESIEGIISEEPMGDAGFGYDPIFFVPEYQKTFAELPEDIKNKISHRAKALAKLRQKLSIIYGIKPG